MKEIKFNYINSSDICNREHKDIGHWGCCCECANHYEVFKHCMYNKKAPGQENECICNESLGFFVCVIPEEIQQDRQRANISGKHSVCELFAPRKNKENKSDE